MCLCVTEPEAGSDVASTHTKAGEKGTEYVINVRRCGQPMEKKPIGVFLLARSDLDPKPKGC